MIVFRYDGSLAGLFSALFEAWHLKKFPDEILEPGLPAPLLSEEIIDIETTEEKVKRVWAGLRRRLSPLGREHFIAAWAARDECGAALFFNYAKAIFTGLDDGDLSHPLVRAISLAARKVGHERQYILQFARFQKTVEGLYLAPLEPRYDLLPTVTDFFQKRFSTHKWIIYDLTRDYGFYYNLSQVLEIQLEGLREGLKDGSLSAENSGDDEGFYQELWRRYFQAIAIPERANPRRQKGFMPKRFWRLLPEMRSVFDRNG